MANIPGNMTPDAASLVGGARSVASFVPGPAGYAADVALAPVQGELEAEREHAQISKGLGGANLEREQHHSKGIRKRLAGIRNRWSERLGEALVSLVGGGMGALVGGILLAGIPVVGPILGAIAGSIVGGWLANKAYNAVFPPEGKDGVELITQIRAAQRQGQAVNPEIIFAAMAANIDGRDGKKLQEKLYKLTGTNDFNVAVQEGKLAALGRMMRDPTFDRMIRSETGMMVDEHNPSKSASEQFGEWINSGQLDARNLLFRDGRLPMESLPMAEYSGMGQGFAPTANLPNMGQNGPQIG